MKEACGEAHLKTILATGELGNLGNVYRASMVCMMAGELSVCGLRVSNPKRISFTCNIMVN